MADLRMFIAIDHRDNVTSYGPYDFAKVTDEDSIPERDEYYDVLDQCEGGTGMQVFEYIKRDDDKWYPIGFSDQDREYAGAYRDLLRRGEIPEGRPGMPRDSMG